MSHTEKYINFSFELYTHKGEFIDKIRRPGMIGRWLGSGAGIIPGPGNMAIIPVPYIFPIEGISEDAYLKATRIQLDENLDKEIGEKEEMILLYEPDKSFAQDLAKKLGANYIYWSEWDGYRFLHVEDLKNGIIEFYYIEELP